MPNDLLGPTPEEVQVWLRFPAAARQASRRPVAGAKPQLRATHRPDYVTAEDRRAGRPAPAEA